MKMHALIAGVAAAAVVSTPASAGITIVTYEGLVRTGYDYTGYFGQAERALDGAHFSARYVLSDDGAAGITFNPPTSSEFDLLHLGAGATLTGASITIFGVTRELSCAGAGDYCAVTHHQSANEGGVWGVSTSLQSFGVDARIPTITDSQSLNLSLTSSSNPVTPSFDYRIPFTYSFQPGDVAAGSLAIARYVDPVVGPGGFYTDRVIAQLAPTSVAVSVPEPGTWGLMLLGFGVAGVALRRRTLSATAA